MPWDCKECNEHVESDEVSICPQCKTKKAEWTLAGGKTRLFRVSDPKRWELLFDPAGTEPRPASESWPARELAGAERGIAVKKAEALAWKQAGQLPPGDRVVVVRCWTKDAAAAIGVRVELVGVDVEKPGAEQQVTWSTSRQEGGRKVFDARFLLVYGAEAIEGLEFADVKVLDISDAKAKTGHAPRVGFAALGVKKRVVVPIDRLEKGWAQRLQCQELEFNHDSHLLLPDGLAVLHVVLAHAKANADRRLVIAGHTDASGEVDRNDVLARDRCDNLRHMLSGDRDAWAASALASYERLLTKAPKKAAADVEFIEEFVGHSSLGGFAGFKQVYDVDLRRSATKVTLDPAKGWKDLASWKAVFDYYELTLLDLVGSPLVDAKQRMLATAKKEAERRTFMTGQRDLHDAARRAELKALRGALQWADDELKTVGCGEHFLKVRTAEKDVTNRRDEFLFFTPDRLPWTAATRPQDEAAARAALYGTGGPSWDYQNDDGPWTFDALDCPADPAIEVPPGNILFVIDISGSMKAVDPVEKNKPVKRPRIEVCKDRLAQTLRRVPSDRKIGMLAFASDVYTWYPSLHRASRRVKEAAYTWVEDLAPKEGDEGFTNTSTALDHALMKFPDVDSIVLLSDGLPTRGTVNERTILAVVRTRTNVATATQKKRRIDTYGFLEGQDLVDDATRAKVEEAYVEALKSTPIVDDREELVQGVARTLKDAGVRSAKTGPRKGEPLTGLDVEQVVLGWFLKELAKENGPDAVFKDLNTLTD